MKTRLNNPRCHILNFRLSPEEFDALRAASVARGSHCLSDFARAAVLGYARTGIAKSEQVEQRIDHLEERVDALCGSVLTALARIDAPGLLPDPAPAALAASVAGSLGPDYEQVAVVAGGRS